LIPQDVKNPLNSGNYFIALQDIKLFTNEGRTRMGADDVLEALYPLLLRDGTPEHIRSDNGPEFAAQAMQD
jgi:hypothetical protein